MEEHRPKNRGIRHDQEAWSSHWLFARLRVHWSGRRSRDVRPNSVSARPETLCALAKAQAEAGLLEEGLITLAEARAFVGRTDQRHPEAKLYRLQAELLLSQSKEDEVEASLHQAERCLQHAMELARRQQAKSRELRATTPPCGMPWS